MNTFASWFSVVSLAIMVPTMLLLRSACADALAFNMPTPVSHHDYVMLMSIMGLLCLSSIVILFVESTKGGK